MDVTTEAIDRVRRFTRFYTRRIGVLQEGLLGSRFSLTEARIVYELAQRTESRRQSSARSSGSTPAISAASCAASRTPG